MTDDGDRFTINRLAAPPRVSELLAADLRSKILSHQLPTGTALPNERDLAELSGVSRSSVRDALRVLEAEGLVETRIGRGGGTFVSRPGMGSLARSLEVFVLGRAVRLGELLQVRELLEPECAALAAEQRTADDLEKLEEIGRKLERTVESPDAFLASNVDWHVAVAHASHNELLAAIMDGISRLVRAGTEAGKIVSTGNFRHALHAHAAVLAAIRDGDADRARSHMRSHVCGYAELLRDHVDAPLVSEPTNEEEGSA